MLPAEKDMFVREERLPRNGWLGRLGDFSIPGGHAAAVVFLPLACLLSAEALLWPRGCSKKWISSKKKPKQSSAAEDANSVRRQRRNVREGGKVDGKWVDEEAGDFSRLDRHSEAVFFLSFAFRPQREALKPPECCPKKWITSKEKLKKC